MAVRDNAVCFKITEEKVIESFGEIAVLSAMECLDEPDNHPDTDFFIINEVLVCEAHVDGAHGPGVWDPKNRSWDWL